MKLSRTLVARLDVAAVQSSAGLRCSKVDCRLAEPILLGAELVHSVLKAGSEIYAMTGVLAIRCNVQASCEVRQNPQVSFGLFWEPMEQRTDGACRLHTSSAVKLDFPNRSGAAKTKSAPNQHLPAACNLLHA